MKKTFDKNFAQEQSRSDAPKPTLKNYFLNMTFLAKCEGADVEVGQNPVN